MGDVRPIDLAKDEYVETGKADVDLRKRAAFSLTMFAEPEVAPDYEQVILDVGADGTSPDRLQLFLDVTGALVFRIGPQSLTVPIGAQLLARSWVSLAVQANLQEGKKLEMRLFVGPDHDWTREDFYAGHAVLGPRLRIGNALSGGRGLKLSFLDFSQLEGSIPTHKIKALLQAGIGASG